MSSVIDTHPKREEIVQALLAGESYRKVAKVAGITHTSVGDYYNRVIKPSVLNGRVASNLVAKRPLSAENVAQVRETLQVAKDDAARAPVIAELARRKARREEMLVSAANDKDYRGFASLDTCEFRDVELEARLLGLLDGSGGNTTIINNGVMLAPAMPQLQAQAPVTTIDVECEERK